MRPASSTRIWSAAAMVERRWAITIEVRPARAVARRLLDVGLALGVEVRCRLVEHDDGGRLRSTRAMARRWLLAPDIRYPRSPTSVSYPSGSAAITSWMRAALHAATTSASVALDRT